MSYPMQLTVLRIILVPVFYLLFAVIDPPQMFWAAIVFLIAALSDWYDGYLARRFNLMTPLGSFLDPLADKLLTSAAFVAFAAIDFVPWWMVIIVIVRDAYLTGFRMLADSIGSSVKTSYFAKLKTFFQMVYIGLILTGLSFIEQPWGVFLHSVGEILTSPVLLYWGMVVVTFLTAASAVQYTIDNWAVFPRIIRRYIFRRSPQKL